MYTGFFGLSEQPFSISPNPNYLYMSYRHKEALAHLNHGLGDSGGFVLLTGEVGTGKTTVSRCMLDQLSDSTEVAFILNPTLSEIELLGTICDEFRIRYKKSDATLKILTDKIKNRLLKNHANGKNTILIIDEAQHLKTEVLEQLRLLTNLETNTKKLLQIILIGQPELQALLKRQELRQLAQRITARYHLLPLTVQEIALYLQHRLRVAGCERPIFDPKAITLIHQTTKGIPRLINLLADRCLMGAYATQSPFVNKKIVARAASEILAFETLPIKTNPWKWLPIPIALILIIVAGLAWYTWEETPEVLTLPTVEQSAVEQPAEKETVDKIEENQTDK
jgi:general secretion pathway protein A